MLYVPSASVVTLRSASVAVLVTDTCTPSIPRLDGSRTTPAILDVLVVCAHNPTVRPIRAVIRTNLALKRCSRFARISPLPLNTRFTLRATVWPRSDSVRNRGAIYSLARLRSCQDVVNLLSAFCNLSVRVLVLRVSLERLGRLVPARLGTDAMALPCSDSPTGPHDRSNRFALPHCREAGRGRHGSRISRAGFGARPRSSTQISSSGHGGGSGSTQTPAKRSTGSLSFEPREHRHHL